MDNYGRIVNEKGRWVNDEGDIVNKYNRKILDKNQLIDNDIPPLMNYDGKKYKIDDIAGHFEKDPWGDIMIQ